MQFTLGQKVRFKDQAGEGTITAIIDKSTVEVDLGDDFPVEYDIDELIYINKQEKMLMPQKEVEKNEAITTNEINPVILGTQLMDLSLCVCPDTQDHYELYLANPEKWEVLFVCHIRIKNKYEYLTSGHIKSMGFVPLGRMSLDRLEFCKELHFQLLHYTTGNGLPQSPLEKNFEWKMSRLAKTPAYLDLLKSEAWVFSLREKEKEVQAIAVDDEVEIPVYQYNNNKPREIKIFQGVKVVDLHIEKLVEKTYNLDNAEMLFIQITACEKAISDALINHHTSLILIHGIGEGRLKAKIHEKLHAHPKVKEYRPADMLKYGGGATEVFFK